VSSARSESVCVAWMCSTVCKVSPVLCSCRQEGDDYKLKLADVNLALGEVGLESGTHKCMEGYCRAQFSV